MRRCVETHTIRLTTPSPSAQYEHAREHLHIQRPTQYKSPPRPQVLVSESKNNEGFETGKCKIKAREHIDEDKLNPNHHPVPQLSMLAPAALRTTCA